MFRFLLHLRRHPALRFGLARDPSSRFRDARFASFLADSNRRSGGTDFQDAVLRSRRLVRWLFLLSLVGGGAWFLAESARALTAF